MHTLRAHLPVNSRAAGLAGIAAESRSPARPQRLRSPAGGNPSVSRPRSVSLAASSSTTEAEVAPSLRPARAARPPDDYDYAAVFRGRSVAYCRDHFPEIVDLAEAGIVVVVERPADYVERREDGYAEPEVVVLVGTSHVSLTSVAHVERAIRAVRPNNTVVELCRSRASIMYTDESGRGADGAGAGPGGGGGSAANEFALGGGQGFTQSLQRSLRLGGAPALLIRAALAAVSRRLGAKVGAAPGGEFRAARRAALACGSQLVLGDRPLEITLSRAWAAASTRHRAEFAAFLLRGLFGAIPEVSQGDIDRVRSDDGIVRQLFVALSERYPALAPPLLYERDAYLAWSLKRSKAVNGAKRVVGVLGRGHLRGVCYALTHEQDALRFATLVGKERDSVYPDGGRRKQGGVDLTRVAAEVVLGVVAWEALCLVAGGEAPISAAVLGLLGLA